MKKIAAKIATMFLISIISFGVIVPPTAVNSAQSTTIVYITKTGKKYHNKGCASLKKSCIETSLQDAVDKGYTPCKKCNPPTLDK